MCWWVRDNPAPRARAQAQFDALATLGTINIPLSNNHSKNLMNGLGGVSRALICSKNASYGESEVYIPHFHPPPKRQYYPNSDKKLSQDDCFQRFQRTNKNLLEEKCFEDFWHKGKPKLSRGSLYFTNTPYLHRSLKHIVRGKAEKLFLLLIGRKGVGGAIVPYLSMCLQ